MTSTPDFAGRDAELQLHEDTKAEWLAEARAARDALFARDPRPMSVDDVRALVGPPPGDSRAFGAIFNRGDWVAVGWTLTHGHGHARPIRLFLPRSAVEEGY